MDYLLFSNANVVCSSIITEDEFLPRDEFSETMCFVRHPGHFKERKYNHPYERKKKSWAYIPYNCGGEYVIGAMFCGKCENFLKMSKTLKSCIEDDLKRNVIAQWHDESQMNRYIIGHKEFRILDCGYCYPVGFDLPLDKKIVGVSKMAKFNVQKFKGTEGKEKNFKYYMDKIIKKIKNNGFVWYVRDSILFKKLETIE
jgi:hypothetical protein